MCGLRRLVCIIIIPYFFCPVLFLVFRPSTSDIIDSITSATSNETLLTSNASNINIHLAVILSAFCLKLEHP